MGSATVLCQVFKPRVGRDSVPARLTLQFTIPRTMALLTGVAYRTDAKPGLCILSRGGSRVELPKLPVAEWDLLVFLKQVARFVSESCRASKPKGGAGPPWTQSRPARLRA